MKQITIIRRKVATTANRLKKMGMSLSAAFKKAWELIKGKAIITKVKGVTFGKGQRALERLTHYRPEQIIIKLERELYNLYDGDAVAVYVGVVSKGVVKVGYLPPPLAKIISTLIDKGVEVKALYGQIRGRYEDYMNYGLEIKICV